VTILAIETSCDETAVAILRGRELLASEVASQIADHEKYGGVVPEVASRNHVLNAPPLLERAVGAAGISLDEVDAFAATSGPGLATSLMVGASLAKGLAIGFRKPYLAINHLEGHLLSPFFGRNHIAPNVSLIVSGGHTMLVRVNGVNNYAVLGRTVDDAAGEAFDKVAKLLGLGYPGGPEIERHAIGGDATRFDLPRSMLKSGDHNFSFSGLKTAVRYLLPKIGFQHHTVISSEVDGPRRLSSGAAGSLDLARDDGVMLKDLCASFQKAVVEVLAAKTISAARTARVSTVTISGGVSCNGELRRVMREKCGNADLQLLVAESHLGTDNAAMIAFAGMLRLEAGESSDVSDEIDPNLALTR